MTKVSTISLKALNRATLARQMLLSRESVGVVRAVERLCGMQAQEAMHPFVGLWCRLNDFDDRELTKALLKRKIIRATMMRCTIHYMSAKDYVSFRTALQPALSSAMGSIFRGHNLDIDSIVSAGRELLDGTQVNFAELRSGLMKKFPDLNDRAMGYAIRTHIPLVMVSTENDRWGYPRIAKFVLAESWLKSPLLKSADLGALVGRYLAAFGPATAADMQAWSSLRGLKGVFESLRPKLVVLRDHEGRELFDLPRAPRPDHNVEAPVRFIPEYDNLILSHADRTRVVPAEYRKLLVTKNLRVLPTLLIDGFVRGTWETAQTKSTMELHVRPFEPIARRFNQEIRNEGQALLRFLNPDANKFKVLIA